MANTWNQRDLEENFDDNGTLSMLDSFHFQLRAGVYDYRVEVPAFSTDDHRVRPVSAWWKGGRGATTPVNVSRSCNFLMIGFFSVVVWRFFAPFPPPLFFPPPPVF